MKQEKLNTYISLLRGINVAGSKMIKMKDLIAAYESLGLKNVVSYVQSGNLIFDTAESSPVKLQERIENIIKKNSGLTVEVLIRTVKDLQRIASSNPFLKKKDVDIIRLYATFLSAMPDKINLETIKNIENKDGNEFVLHGQEIYLHCPNGYGRSKLSNNFFEKKLQVIATTRNWKTIMSLLELSSRPSK